MPLKKSQKIVTEDTRHESWIRAETIIASHISKWYAEGRKLDLSDDLIILREKVQSSKTRK